MATLALAALYVALGTAAVSGRTRSFDRAMRHRHKRPRRGSRRFAADAVRLVGQPWMQLVYAVATAELLRLSHVRRAMVVIASVGAAFLAESTTKRVVRRRRPPGYAGRKTFESYPSGHTAAATALALSIAAVLERDGRVRAPLASLLALVLGAYVGDTRLTLDDHWTTDVAGGYVLGSAAVFAALASAPRVERLLAASVGPTVSALRGHPRRTLLE